MDEMSIEQARKKLGDVVNRAFLADEPTVITRNGMPAAVVVSTKWFDANRPVLELHYKYETGKRKQS